jgi:hypothetical protein
MKPKVMKSLLLVALFAALPVVSQELLLPMNSMFKDEYLLSTYGDSEIGFKGTGVFPATQGAIERVEYLEADSSSRYKWLRRKLFHEHFAQVKGDDYFIFFDPLINGAVGRERGIAQNNLFQNTRGFQVSGEVMNKVSFFTSFYENQARFASYQQDYFSDRSEQRIVGGNYIKEHAVIPGGGRTKPFGDDGFDYASSMSYVRYRPSKYVALQFGNNPNFIGWGHRSLLLSDNSFNATTLRIDITLGEKWNYSILNSKHLNLWRRQFTNAVESPYEKKNYSAHYLTYKATERLTIGLFESTVYFREDSIQSQWMHPLYFNPVIGVNTAVFGWENQDAKSLVGLNFAYSLGKKHLVFGQLATDELSSSPQYGIQLGWRSADLFGVKNLTAHMEYNKATERLYAANNRRMAYTHFNLPLAHTLGNGFDEVVGRASYMYKSFYIQTQGIFYQSDQAMEFQSNLFESRELELQFDRQNVLLAELEVGYRFNPRTNLCAFTKVIYRQSEGETAGLRTTGMVFFGLKTRLFNQYMDF